MAYKMWAEYLGEGDEHQDRMENDRNEMRNALDHKKKQKKQRYCFSEMPWIIKRREWKWKK